ncbi:alpha-1 4-glucan-protein synthase [Haladaptatus litoreus]|nr:alpha-1 4-glucan-protein synthase [Haladaptatus litoreus]
MRPDICVIMPTIREFECLRSYFQNAREHDFDLDRLHIVLVTEDFCSTAEMQSLLDDADVDGEVFDGTRRRQWFEEHEIAEYTHLIPEASHAQTSFGLLYMWANDFTYGLFIDDDTLPHLEFDYFGTHLNNLGYEGEIDCVSSNSNWVNVLYQNVEDHGLYPRGYPYTAMGESITAETRYVDDVVASQGLWTNVPDLDAVRILMDGDLQGQAQTRTTASDFTGTFATAPDQYLTVCSMNLAFKREVIPAFYQLPMDDNEWDVGRFDDIWSGVFLKRAADVLDKQILTGGPLCEHNKAPRPTFDDLANEAPGLELNEYLWQIIDDVGTDGDSYAEVFAAMADVLADGDWSMYNNGAFLNHVGAYMRDWLDCLAELDSIRRPLPADD